MYMIKTNKHKRILIKNSIKKNRKKNYKHNINSLRINYFNNKIYIHFFLNKYYYNNHIDMNLYNYLFENYFLNDNKYYYKYIKR